MANNLTSLERALDLAVAAATNAQKARDEARAGAGLPPSPPAFFTCAEMIGKLCQADDRHRAEMREVVAAVIADTRYRLGDPTFKPDATHRMLIALFGAPEATEVSNVVPLRHRRKI
jgi:hypothetical protein